jgi:hypothetical protein
MAAPVSESSIKELLTITKAQKLVDGMRNQFDSLMDKGIQQGLNGKQPTAKQQQAIANMKNKMVSVMQNELTWEKLEPMYLRLYSESFTEEEAAGMLSFYKTPAGQAVINKMPTLTLKTTIEVQKMVMGVGPQMQKIQEEFTAEMKAASE